MIHFFENVIVVTGGVLCIGAWLAVLVEVVDRVTESRKPTVEED